MDTYLTPTEMIRLAREDLGRLRTHFLDAINASVATGLPSQRRTPLHPRMEQVFQILKVTGLSLDQLGIDSQDRSFREGVPSDPLGKLLLPGLNLHWDQLCFSLNSAQPDDAVMLFGLLADSLKANRFVDCTWLMKEALRAPWSCQAIESRPDFFLRTKAAMPGEDRYEAVEQRCHNAFQILAAMALEDEPLYVHTLEVIRFLKRIGLQDDPDLNGRHGLHWAADRRHTAAFQAFLEEFPEHLETRDRFGCVPLHQAAISSFPDNVTLLLDAGVNPRPLGEHDESALGCAMANEMLPNAMLLLETGAYDDLDVANACDAGPSHAEKLLAFHAALKARRAIERGCFPEDITPRSLWAIN